MKITIDKQVIEQALEALDCYVDQPYSRWEDHPVTPAEKAITALRSALAEIVEQEPPVAWMFDFNGKAFAEYPLTPDYKPVYLHPAPAVPVVEKYREALEMARDVLNMNWAVIDTATKQEALAKIEEVLK